LRLLRSCRRWRRGWQLLLRGEGNRRRFWSRLLLLLHYRFRLLELLRKFFRLLQDFLGQL
jgi:hypothetical protein